METYTYPPVDNRRALELPERPLEDPTHVGLFQLAFNAIAGVPTRGMFVREFLPLIGAPVTTHTMVAMMAWMQAEGDAGAYNPLNSTHTMPGSTDFNWVHVQNYSDLMDGVKATAMTLNYGADRHLYGYRPIRAHLRDNSRAIEVVQAVEASAWGTGGLCVRVLEETGWRELNSKTYRHHRLAH